MSSATKFLPIEFQPGIRRDTTEYAAEGRWYSGDKIRFRDGFPQTIGGWQPFTGGSFLGFTRAVTQWSKLTGESYVGFGTNSHLYIWDKGSFKNVTPVDASVSLNNNLSTINGATSVIVSVNGHGRSSGDYITILNTDVIPAFGTSLSGEYSISSIIDVNTFVITVSTTAAATSTGTGGGVNAVLPLASGLQSNIESFGWGRGGWGSGGWSEGVSSGGVIQELRTWSLSPWGEDLLANPKGGRIYQWDATTGLDVRATLVTASPSVVDYSFVASELRQVVALGTTDVSSGSYDPLLVRWCASENYNDWSVSAANDGGFYRLEGGTEIKGYVQSRNETLIWTDSVMYSMKYIGGDDVYSFSKLGENVSPCGPKSIIDVGGVVYWMSHRGFYRYDGQVNQLPCTLQRDVFSYDGQFSLDHTQEQKTYCGVNTAFSEVWWLYQGIDSTNSEINRYIVYNFREDTWVYGTLARSAWLDSGALETPLGFGTDGVLYYHELGLAAGNNILESYLKSAPFDVVDGDEMLLINRIVPDFTLTNQAYLTIETKPFPNGPVTQKGPFTITPTTEKIDMYARGRQATITVGSSAPDTFWRLGKVRLGVKTNGRR